MKHLFTSAAAIALLAACGGGDKEPEAQKDAPKFELSAEHPDISAISSFTPREGDAAKASDVLTALNLDSSGAGFATFADSSIDGDGATFTDVVIAPGGPDEAVKIGKVELDGLDMTDAGAVFSKLSVSDLEVGDEYETAKLDNFTIVNPSAELASFLTSAFSGEDPGEFPSLDKLTFDAISFGDFTFEGGDDDDGGVIKIANIDLRGMGGGQLEAAVLSGLTFGGMDAGEKLDGGIGKIALYGADYDFIEDIQAAGADLDEDEMFALIASSMSDATDPPYDGIVMEGLSFVGQGVDFSLPLMDVIVQRDDQDRMTATVMKPLTMKLSADPEGGYMGADLAEGLSMLGYKDITLKMEGVTAYDPDADIVSYQPGSNYIELVDGAKISYGGKLGGFAAYSKAAANMQTAYGPDPAAAMEALGQLTIHDFSLTIDDASLVDRIFNVAASQMGEDPQKLRSQTIMGMGFAQAGAQAQGIDSALASEAISALTEFLEEPGKLTFSVSPSEPLVVGEINDPSVLTKDFLGFSATHE